MPNKANKFSKRVKSLTANVEGNPLPKEPLSALAVAVAAAEVEVVAEVTVINRHTRANIRVNIVAMMMTMTIRRVKAKAKIRIKTRVIAKRNSRLTGLKLLSSVLNVLSKISRRQPTMPTTL